jgi:hypothetical protein
LSFVLPTWWRWSHPFCNKMRFLSQDKPLVVPSLVSLKFWTCQIMWRDFGFTLKFLSSA